jgi:hypothetical protein
MRDSEIEEEIAYHLAMLAEEQRERGSAIFQPAERHESIP